MKFSMRYKLSLSSVFLVLLSIVTVGGLFYFKTTELLVDQTLDNIIHDVDNAEKILQTRINTLRDDVLFLANIPPTREIVQTNLSSNGNEKRKDKDYQHSLETLEGIIRPLLQRKTNYLKIRLIDKSGQELLVVGREKDNILTFRGKQLQNKAHRRYVQDTLALDNGFVYLSEINLNREFGEITLPHQEVLRGATPIYDQLTGEVAALIVISIEFGAQLKEIQRRIHEKTGSEIYITNDKGGYLLHPDSNKTYGFDLGTQYRVQEDFPNLATMYSPQNHEKQLLLLPEHTDGKIVANFNKIIFDPANKNRYIAVVITQQYNNIVERQTGVLTDVTLWAVVLSFIAMLLGIVLSIRLTHPIKQMTIAVNDFAHKRKTSAILPIEEVDEVGVLAKTFSLMLEQVESAQADLQKMNQNLERLVEERTRSLEASQARQRAIVENMVDGLILINDKGEIQSFNQAAETIFGFPAEDVIGKNIKLLMPEPYHSEHDGYLAAYHDTGEKKVIGIGREVEGLRRDGSVFPIDLAVSALEIGGEKMYSGIVRDITERKLIERMKNEFISTVSHELRTPLTSIRGSIDLVMGGSVGDIPATAKEMIGIASNNTERLLLLINDILDIQKIESGQMAFKFQNTDVNEFLERAIKDTASYAQQYEVKFKIVKTIEDAQVFVDKDRLMQVLANLISNAAKFSPSGDTVEIIVARHEDAIRISVTDHGPGIPEEFHSRLFEKFTQVDSTDTRKKGGTGLGLNISKTIIEKLGGYLDFVSREGIGTTFFIELPEVIGVNLIDDSNPYRILGKHLPCILIVEDDPDVATLIRRMLAESGFNSDIAESVEDARLLLKEKPGQYRAITLDLVLPGEDGIAFLKQLRREAETYDLPVVIVSVKADETKRDINGGAVGVVDWLQKPIDRSRLIEAVKRAAGPNRLPRVLHVEDETDIHNIVSNMLREYCELTWTTSLTASREVIANDNFDLVLLDIGLPDGSGLDLLDDIKRQEKPPQVVIFSASNVSEEYAKAVNTVLLKSETDSRKLADVIRRSIHPESGFE